MDPIIEKEKRYTAHNYHPLDMVISRGRGAFLWDREGRRYIDMMSAYSAANHGHCHPRILSAMENQARNLCITSRAFHTDKLAPFTEKICQLSGMDMALPMNTGAEAVETAIKAARLWGYKVKNIPKNKAKIIVARDNFHGRTSTIVGFSSDTSSRDGFGPFSNGFKTVEFGNSAALEQAITDNVCAFLVEPIQGEAGVIIPPKGWLKEVSRICKKHNILLILDEIQSGLGRSGKMFAFEHEIKKPDCLILGKALGGGVMPVSCFLAKKEVMDLFVPGTHGSTFGGNPLACAVGIEALNVLKEDNLIENSKHLGEYMIDRLKSIESSLITDIRGQGLFVAVDIHPDFASARQVCEKLAKKFVLTKDTHEKTVRLAPPLIITREILDDAIAAFEETLVELEFNIRY